MYVDKHTDPDFDWPSLNSLLAADGNFCERTRNGWYCTRMSGHDGDHVAHSGKSALAAWNNKSYPKAIVIQLHVEN